MNQVGNKQKTHLVSNKDKMEPLPPGPVFLNLLPASAGGVKATQAEVSKTNILSGSKVARQSLTRQPSNLHIWHFSVQSFFSLGSLALVK